MGQNFFSKAAEKISSWVGSSAAFTLAVSAILIWAILGPLFGFSDTWQLVINTGTTIITFLMVFLIQNMQNREAKATQLKLDELIKSSKRARNRLIDIEEATDEELARLQKSFRKLKNKVS